MNTNLFFYSTLKYPALRMAVLAMNAILLYFALFGLTENWFETITKSIVISGLLGWIWFEEEKKERNWYALGIISGFFFCFCPLFQESMLSVIKCGSQWKIIGSLMGFTIFPMISAYFVCIFFAIFSKNHSKYNAVPSLIGGSIGYYIFLLTILDLNSLILLICLPTALIMIVAIWFFIMVGELRLVCNVLPSIISGLSSTMETTREWFFPSEDKKTEEKPASDVTNNADKGGTFGE